MKKSLFFVAVATLFVVSCQKELNPSEQTVSNDTPCFKASIEQLADFETKATINASNQFVWATGDKIGIWFPSWGEKNQAFTLSGGNGTTEGTFTRDQSADYSPTDASAAFFPWNNENNVGGDGNVYFELKSEYWSYNSGDMLTPLVASITSSNDISFKHAGAAVKLTVNNLVSGTYAVKMSVYNKQISGYFHVNPANAGTDALVLNDSENTSLNSVTLNSWKSTGAFNWIFPVPELTKPKLKFEITDDNGILVWKKSLAAQANDVKRGEILVMPAVSVTPYSQFTLNTTWGVSGEHNSWGDTKMVSDGTLFIAKSVTFAANQQFKVRKDGAWTTSYGYDQLNGVLSGSNAKDKWHVNAVAGTENNNIKITAAGTYDIIINTSDSDYCGYKAHEIRVVQNGFPYPLPKETASITIDGTFTDWATVSSESAGNTTVKVVSDNSKVSFYVNITGVESTVWGNANRYVYALFDLDGNPDNDVEQWGNKGDFIMLLYPYGGSSESPSLITSPDGNWLCNPSTGSYTISHVSLNGTMSDADGSGNRTVTYEFSIPRTDMPTIPSTEPVTITIKGSPISSNVSISRLL